MLGAILTGIVGCGADSPTGKKVSEKPGRVYIQNETTMIVEVYYVDVEGTKIETAIDPWDTGEATREVLDGGTKVVLNVNPVRSCRSDVTIEVTVDGNRTVRVLGVGACGTKQVDMTIT